MGNETIHAGACPTCGALAQAIAEGDGTVYRHIDLSTLRQQAGRVDEDVSEQVRRLREFVAESPEHYFGIGTCKIIGSHDRNYSVRDNLLYMIDRITEAALAQQVDGEAVAVVDAGEDGMFVEILYGADGSPLKVGDKLYLHAERARVPDALRHAAKVIELYDDALGGSCEMATSTDCAEVLTALADYYADAPSQRAKG